MKITRSFQKTIQIRQYEPVVMFCGAEAECEEKDAFKVSANLDEFVRQEVESTLAVIRPPMKDIKGKSRGEKKDLKEEVREGVMREGINDIES